MVAIIVFITNLLWSSWEDIRLPEKVDLLMVFLSFLTLVGVKLYSASIWYIISVFFDINLSYFKTLISYFSSLLGRYIPGKVFEFAGRVLPYKEAGYPMSVVSLAFMIEKLIPIYTAFLIFFVFVTFNQKVLPSTYDTPLIIMIVVGFLLFNPIIINILIRYYKKICPNTAMGELKISSFKFYALFFLNIFQWFGAGMAFYFLIRSIVPQANFTIFFITSIYSVSNVIGMLALFAPAGFGVREGVLSFLLNLNLGNITLSLLLVVFMRLLVTMVEIFIVVFLLLFNNFSTLVSCKERVDKN